MTVNLCAAEIMVKATNFPHEGLEKTGSRPVFAATDNRFVLYRGGTKDYLLIEYDSKTNLVNPVKTFKKKHEAREALYVHRRRITQ